MRVPELPSRKQHGMNKYQLVFDTRIERASLWHTERMSALGGR